MGFTYADLERYLTDGPEAVSPALALRLERLVRSSEHKRCSPPRRRLESERPPEPDSAGTDTHVHVGRHRLLRLNAASLACQPARATSAPPAFTDGVGRRLEFDQAQLRIRAAAACRPRRFAQDRSQTSSLASMRRDRLFRRLERRADEAVGQRDALVDGDLRIQQRNQYLAQLRLQHVVEELERVGADDRVRRADADIGIVQARLPGRAAPSAGISAPAPAPSACRIASSTGSSSFSRARSGPSTWYER